MLLMQQQILSGGGVSFLDLPFHFHIRAWDGINVDGGGNFVSLTDLTGNGIDFAEDPATLGTSPIEIVPSAIGGKQGLRFDGTNQIFNNSLGLSTSVNEIFLFIIFKIEGNPTSTVSRIFSVENTRISEGNRYGIINNSGVTYGWSTSASNLNSTRPYLGDHWGWLNVKSSPFVTGEMMFALDGETTLTTSIGVVTPGYNNTYCAIGGNRNRYSRMLFCEAGMMVGNFDLITPDLLSSMANYMNETYGL